MSAFTDVTDALGALVEEKNAAYGDATRTGVEAMKALYPNGVKPEQYERFGYCLLVWHKLSRLATKPDAFGENPIHDIAGYSVLALAREKKRAARVAAAKYEEDAATQCPSEDEPNGGVAEAFLDAAKKAKASLDGTVFGITAASYEKYKDGKVREPDVVCRKCKKAMGKKPSEWKCWTCFYVDNPSQLFNITGETWKETANARELEEVPRLFIMGKMDDGSLKVGGLPRPPLGKAPDFGDLSKRWDAGVFEGTGKGYTPPSAPARPRRLGTYRGPLWAGKEAAKGTATGFADLFRAMAPLYKVGSHVPYPQVTLELQSKHTGYWLKDRRGLKERVWVITGVL